MASARNGALKRWSSNWSAFSTLYVLSGGLVRRSTDLSTWTTVAAAPADASSLGVLDRQLYVGTADSKLYRLGGVAAP